MARGGRYLSTFAIASSSPASILVNVCEWKEICRAHASPISEPQVDRHRQGGETETPQFLGVRHTKLSTLYPVACVSSYILL